MARSSFSTQTVTIASADTVSTAIDARGYNQFGLIKPATTGTAITFQVSTSSAGTFTALLSSAGTAVSLTVQAGAGTYPLPDSLKAFPYFKIVSGSSEAATRSLVVTKAKV